MVSSVKSRPNHYRTLGLEPVASADEISDAFARKMSLFQADPLGAAAQICIAYETLRDPVKRREHDRLLGLAPERKPQAPQWKYAVTQPRWAPLIAAAEKNLSTASAGETARIPEPQVSAPSQPETSVDPRLAAIAASVRELAKPAGPDTAIRPKPQRSQPRSAQLQPDMRLEEVIEHIRSVGRAEKERLHRDKAAFDWKRPALTLGALLVGAGVFGALAGLSLKGDENPGQSGAARTHFHAVPEHHPQLAQLSPPVALFADTPRSVRAARRVSTTRGGPPISSQRRASLFEQQIVGSLAAPDAPANNEPGKIATGQAATDQSATGQVATVQPATVQSATDQPATDAARKVPASLPLSRAVIAHTIERIGYPCGEVAATTAADGEMAGVFRVTCTSGHTYQATPVAGRYHFRRVKD